MYKKQSLMMQERAVRSVITDLRSAGIDPETWQSAESKDLLRQRDCLIDHKLRCQQQLNEINTRIKRAGSIARETGRYQPPAVYQGWLDEKNRVAAQDIEICAHLRQIKEVMREKKIADYPRREAPAEYYVAFYEMARELLAGPVFERVRTAAHHRTQEAAE